MNNVLSWLSSPRNNEWLVIVDNVDRDLRRREEDTEVYNIEEYLPEADHGAVLIMTRLHHLGQLGENWEVKSIKETARAIFQTWYGKEIGEYLDG